MFEENYIMNLGSHLRNFKRVAPQKYKCSCNICGDSKTVSSKTRGSFFLYKGEFFYNCFNCGASYSLKQYLKEFFPNMYDEYIFEKFGYGKRKVKTPELKLKTKKPEFKTSVLSGDDILQLNYQMSHEAVVYLNRRGFTEDMIDELYYTDNFKKYVNDTLIKDKFNSVDKPDPRIVIPFFSIDGKVIGMQGRSIDPNNPVRYITIKLIDDNEPLLYGLDKISQSKDVYVFEGPIDAMFIDNAVAWAGGSLNKVDGVLFPVLVWDNDYHNNKDIQKQLRKAIRSGMKVVLWPDRNKYKDVNDMILNGINVDAKYLKENTYQGLLAELELGRQIK